MCAQLGELLMIFSRRSWSVRVFRHRFVTRKRAKTEFLMTRWRFSQVRRIPVRSHLSSRQRREIAGRYGCLLNNINQGGFCHWRKPPFWPYQMVCVISSPFAPLGWDGFWRFKVPYWLCSTSSLPTNFLPLSRSFRRRFAVWGVLLGKQNRARLSRN